MPNRKTTKKAPKAPKPERIQMLMSPKKLCGLLLTSLSSPERTEHLKKVCEKGHLALYADYYKPAGRMRSITFEEREAVMKYKTDFEGLAKHLGLSPSQAKGLASRVAMSMTFGE